MLVGGSVVDRTAESRVDTICTSHYKTYGTRNSVVCQTHPRCRFQLPSPVEIRAINASLGHELLLQYLFRRGKWLIDAILTPCGLRRCAICSSKRHPLGGVNAEAMKFCAKIACTMASTLPQGPPAASHPYQALFNLPPTRTHHHRVQQQLALTGQPWGALAAP